jgi:hypothetical protein
MVQFNESALYKIKTATKDTFFVTDHPIHNLLILYIPDLSNNWILL